VVGLQEEGREYKLDQSPSVDVCTINLNLKRPFWPALADKKKSSAVVEWRLDTTLFLRFVRRMP
jgi:hypothetical protein